MSSLTPQKPLETAAYRDLPTGRRIACLWFPHWLIETYDDGFESTCPFALVEMKSGAQRVAALNPCAMAAGLFVGMSLADARAVVTDLQTAPVNWGRLKKS